MMRSMLGLLVALLLVGCAGNPYLDVSLKQLEGKDKAQVEDRLGAPSTKAPRFFGGESWTYYRITLGDQVCDITVDFDRDGIVTDTSHSGC